MAQKELILKLKDFDPELDVLNYKGELRGNEKYGTYGTDILEESSIHLCEEDGKKFIEIF